MKIQHGNYVRLENEMNTRNIGNYWVLNKMCFLINNYLFFLYFMKKLSLLSYQKIHSKTINTFKNRMQSVTLVSKISNGV